MQQMTIHQILSNGEIVLVQDILQWNIITKHDGYFKYWHSYNFGMQWSLQRISLIM